MSVNEAQRVLILTDRAEPSEELLMAIRDRVAFGDTDVQVLLPDPARAEMHVLHPERHAAAGRLLEQAKAFHDQYAQAAGRQVGIAVAIRHDPVEAASEYMIDHPVDEIVVCVHEHSLDTRFHHEVAQRLRTQHPDMLIATCQRQP